MKQRILVAVVGIPLLLAVLCWAPDWATALLLAALSVIAAHELLTAVCGAEKAKRWTALPAVTGALVIAAVYFSGEHYADSPAGTVLRWLIAAAVLALLLASVLTYGRPGALVLQDVCVMAVAGLVIPWAFSCMLQLRMLPHGAGMVLMPLVAAFCSDSAALFTGMACGRHKMAPLVSPHKTVEGALGGIAGGVVGMVIFRILFLHACAAAHRLVRGHRPCRRADGRAGRSELFRHQAAGRHQGLRPPAAGSRRRARPV